MKMILDEQDRKEVSTIAADYNVLPSALEELYEDIMVSNFWQDLHDIARDNDDYLRKEYGDYEGQTEND